MRGWVVGIAIAVTMILPIDGSGRSAAAEAPELGQGWTIVSESDFTYYEPAEDAHVWHLRGPDTSAVRVILTQLPETTANQWDAWFQDRFEDQRRGGGQLVPAAVYGPAPLFVRPAGCARDNSVAGVDPLVGLHVASTICLTEDGLFIDVGVVGEWENEDGDKLSYADASTEIVSLVLEMDTTQG